MQDDESPGIIKIDLNDQGSIMRFTDTIFMNGDFGKLKLDTSLEAVKASRQMTSVFEGLQSTYLTLNSDSSYKLDNQPTLFGFIANSVYRNPIIDKWSYSKKEKWLALKIADGEYRDYVVLRLSKDSLILDEVWREIKGPPVKELTLIRQ